MSEYTLITAIVPAGSADTYRHIAAQIHPAGEGMFVTPLYTGSELTHYISTGMIDTGFGELVSDPELFAEVMDVPIEQAHALKSGFTHLAVGEAEEPQLHNHGAIEALGLSLNPSSDEIN